MNRSTELLFYGEGSKEMAESAFGMEADNGFSVSERCGFQKETAYSALMEAAQMQNEYA